jgi:hypothetical protein
VSSVLDPIRFSQERALIDSLFDRFGLKVQNAAADGRLTTAERAFLKR